MPPAQARALGALLLDGGGVATAALVAGLGGPDWAALMEAAGRELLTPELGPALSRPEVAAVVPPEVAEHVRGVRALNAARNARIEAQAREMLPAFGEAGLSPFLLKGSRVFADPDPGRRDRVLRDLDLLFEPAELGAAEAVLSRLGYRALDRDPGGHAVAYYARDGEPAAVDLHREALIASHVLPAADALRRARRATAFGAPALVADPADEVLLRALHEMVHHDAYRDGVVSLRALLDVAVRLAALDAADWRELRGRAEHARALTPLAAMLRLAGWVFGPSVLPPEAEALANGKLARAAAGRVWHKAARRLPGIADVVWGQAVGRLAGHGYRPAADGAFAAWWVRQCALGILHAPGWLRQRRTGRAGA